MKLLFGRYDREASTLPSIEMKRSGPALICLFFLAVFAAKFIYDGTRSQGHHLTYNLLTLAINYFQFGALRRALVGSIIYLSVIDLVTAAYLLYGVSVILILIGAYVSLRRITQAGGTILQFVLILGALLLFWSEDVGRTDILVAAILLMAALALVDGSIVLASLYLAIGLQIHEVAAIYGLPLFAALLLEGNRYKNIDLRAAAIATLIIVGGILFYVVVWFLPHANNHFIAETIKPRLPTNYPSDATKFKADLLQILGGGRGVVDTMCQISHSVHYYIKPFVALLMVALAAISMSGARLKWAFAVIATVPPLLFLWMTAADMSRWVALAIFNVWIICAVIDFEPVRGAEPEGGAKRWAWVRAVGAAAIVPLLFPLTIIPVQAFISYPSPLIEGGIEKVIGRPTIKPLDECDPTWRALFS
jgi:hypothetical protein